ncbi:hypothetical protein PMI42_02450, partial [Bradyrhizobium sp. YR681]|uniref:hypothetical protein n=1 Tax=Bradyrhizobium sp. YR681 TaxID=1144344 RepID=UPI0002714893
MIAVALVALALIPMKEAPRPEAGLKPLVQQVQVRCGDGFDYNYSDGRCYPNGHHPPGVYDNRGGYGRGGQARRGCGDGYDYNYSDGRCYPNGYHAPGAYDNRGGYGRGGQP